MTADTDKYALYIDDSGSRNPDESCFSGRHDGMDCFALGGILIKAEDAPGIMRRHKAFCDEWNIDYPLHSSSIRGGHGKFGWLKKPENAGGFLPELENYILSLPIIGIACVIDRPGYVARYKDLHRERLWLMCKTAFSILIERAAKFADTNGRKLEVFFEETGKREDRAIVSYMKELKQQGNPFDAQTAGDYAPLSAADYRRIVLGRPERRKKKLPLIQLADLMLYPMAKGGYDPEYRPYKHMRDAGKLIDCLIDEEEIPVCGIKYSCFDR
jgi:hypothetical protein